MFCGNGGSAADAQHFAAEFIVRLRLILIENLYQLVIGSRHINLNSMWK